MQERAKLARENRETASLKNAEMRFSLVRSDEIRRAIFSAARSVRNSMQTIPDRISMPVAGMTDNHDIHELISKELSEVLESLDNDWASLLPEENDEQDRDRNTVN